MEHSITESDWLFPHHPIPNAKSPPITTLLIRSTHHKSANGFPPPVYKYHGHLKSMNKLTVNEPAENGIL